MKNTNPLQKLFNFLSAFFLGGSGGLSSGIRLYYLANLIVIPIFLIMAADDSFSGESPVFIAMMVWVLFATLVNDSARGLALNAGKWFAGFLWAAARTELVGFFAAALAIIAMILIFYFALALAIIVGGAYLWFLSLYELGKDALDTLG